ncbi:MAG: hypothetical protein JO148_02850 [Acidimicrobiia bacterium]|nr:hypothetical protein [Acidimicrobiia bacterium]
MSEEDETRERFSIEYAVTFNAVNFGSGWHPHLDKEPDSSGSVTMMTRLRRRFDDVGLFTASELAELTAATCAQLFGQRLRPPVDELMALFARSLNDLGRFLLHRFDGSFDALVAAAGASADVLVRLLQEMPMYRDVTEYGVMTVPFLKRAQLTASDIGGFEDIDRLTLFADNLIPHVLRVEGALLLDGTLASAIDNGELLEPGGAAEVELRAAAVVVGERIAASSGGAMTPAVVDNRLWHRGQSTRFKAVPRPRIRSTFY